MQQQAEIIKEELAVIECEHDCAKADWNQFPHSLADKDMYKEKIKGNGVQFLDVNFPPNQVAITGKYNTDEVIDRLVHWKRPLDFLNGSHPILFSEDL